MENVSTPTALILSRQNIKSLPEGNPYADVAKGAYIVAGSDRLDDFGLGMNEVVLLASGSEVSTLIAGAELLREKGVKCRIVSVPSEGLFRSQSPEYQEEVIPSGANVFGLTAGLPVNLQGLVGSNGVVFGLESFGFSAPYKVLDDTSLDITTAQANNWTVALTAVVPVIIAVCGVAVWVRRKNS